MSIAEKFEIIADEVFEVGKKTEYNDFWDKYQQKGAREDYQTAFAGSGWNDQTFKPKYNIAPKNAYMMFRYSTIEDLPTALENAGVTLNTSNSTDLSYAFAYGQFKHIGEVSCVSADVANCVFFSSRLLETIDKFIVRSDGSNTFTNTFVYCYALKNIAIEGVIGNSINFTYSPLTVESMKNIIGALKNHKGTDKEGQCTLTFSQSCWNDLHNSGETAPDGSASWTDYVKYVLGWNV